MGWVCEALEWTEAMYTMGYNSIPVKFCKDAEFPGSSRSRLTLHCMTRKVYLHVFTVAQDEEGNCGEATCGAL